MITMALSAQLLYGAGISMIKGKGVVREEGTDGVMEMLRTVQQYAS